MGNVIYLAGRDQAANVLLIEREPLMRSRTAAHLREAGLSVMEAVDGAEVLKLLRAGRTVRVVLGNIDRDLALTLRREFPQVTVVIGVASDSLDISHTELSTVRRPYDPAEIEHLAKALLLRSSSR